MLPPVKKSTVVLSHQHPPTYLFRIFETFLLRIFACKQCLICPYFSPDSEEKTFSLEKAILWFEVKNVLILNLLQTCTFLFHMMLIDGLESCGLLVDYCDVFISCLESHSEGTHSLQRIHWWASDVMLNLCKSVLMKKQTYLHVGWPEGEYIFSIFSFLGEPFL